MTARSTTQAPWIQRLQPFAAVPRSGLRLVCFPHAGGSAGYFRPLGQALVPHIETLAVQYPGRLDRRHEPPIESVPQLADAAFEALRHSLDGPFAFFGHSLGAVVAFEVARRFEQLTPAGPVRLFASARRAPSVVKEEYVHLRDDDGLIAEMRRLGGTDETLLNDKDIRELVLPAVRADYRAVETYTAAPGARVTCPITVFVGDHDPVTPVADTAPWDGHTAKDADIQVFDGGHFYLDQRVADVAAAIVGAL